MAKGPKPPAPTCIMRAALAPDIYRDIEIRATDSLENLAAAIIGAFDFDMDHAFGFFSKLTGNIYASPVRYELFADIGDESDALSVRQTTIATAFPRLRSKLLFLFDYGDEWRFRVERTGAGETLPKIRYPRVVAKAGAAPPQYPPCDED